MTRHRFLPLMFSALLVLSALGQAGLFAQAKPKMAPAVTSPEVHPDGRVTLRIHAPEAKAVGLSASDVLGMGGSAPAFVKKTDGVWEATIGPLKPGAFRYTFTVDGVAVVDPRNPAVSESNANVWSLAHVPGAAFMDTAQVPHGAVAAVPYYSTALGRYRRMHVYTPPGYESGKGKFPVFYLLHGAGDCDHSWSSVGRAGFILDNLIAAKKARPMIVVMPAGHASADFSMGAPGNMVDAFAADFRKDIVPLVEGRYRVAPGRGNRAIAGLSMGGMQTLELAIGDLSRYAYIGVFSSGVFSMGAKPKAGAPAAAPAPGWEEQHKAALGNAALKKDLRLLWFATGSDDFLIETTRNTVAMLQKHGFTPVYKETGGGHTWDNWREYLREFAPQLFR